MMEVDMKKVLVALIAIMMVPTVAFAGPFVRCDVGLAQTPSYTVDFTMGYKSGGFVGSFTANDVFSVTHTLDFDASMAASGLWWGSKTTLAIDDITLDPNPIKSVAFGWLGTVHLGALLATDTDLAPYTLDLYGGFDVKYQFAPTAEWTPTGKIGFYWELN